jgi:hypothetical protein
MYQPYLQTPVRLHGMVLSTTGCIWETYVKREKADIDFEFFRLFGLLRCMRWFEFKISGLSTFPTLRVKVSLDMGQLDP